MSSLVPPKSLPSRVPLILLAFLFIILLYCHSIWLGLPCSRRSSPVSLLSSDSITSQPTLSPTFPYRHVFSSPVIIWTHSLLSVFLFFFLQLTGHIFPSLFLFFAIMKRKSYGSMPLETWKGPMTHTSFSSFVLYPYVPPTFLFLPSLSALVPI